MVSRRGLGIGLIIVGVGAAVGIALLMQPVRAANLCMNVTCPTGYICDPNTGKCVPQNPVGSSFTLTIGAVDTSGTPLSGLSATIDASTPNTKAIIIPSSQVLSPGTHTVSIPQNQTVALQTYTFDHWSDLAAPNNTNFDRVVTLNADMTIGAVFRILQLATINLTAQVSDLNGFYHPLAMSYTLNGVSVHTGPVNLPVGSVNSISAPDIIQSGGGLGGIGFLQWSDGVTLLTRNFTAANGLTLTAQYCCILSSATPGGRVTVG